MVCHGSWSANAQGRDRPPGRTLAQEQAVAGAVHTDVRHKARTAIENEHASFLPGLLSKSKSEVNCPKTFRSVLGCSNHFNFKLSSSALTQSFASSPTSLHSQCTPRRRLGTRADRSSSISSGDVARGSIKRRSGPATHAPSQVTTR